MVTEISINTKSLHIQNIVFLPSEDLTFQNLKKAYEIPVHDGPLAVSVSSAIKTKIKGYCTELL